MEREEEECEKMRERDGGREKYRERERVETSVLHETCVLYDHEFNGTSGDNPGRMPSPTPLK